MMKRTLSAAVLVTAVLLWGEAMHWRSSRRRLGNRPGPGRAETVVVLGYRNRGEHANLINRQRVRAALRSQTAGSRSALVLCGGAVAGRRSEAEIMAAYARGRCGYAGPIELDTRSRSTPENIRNAIPLVEGCDRIVIVSNSLHAEVGREYLRRLRPDLAERLVRGADYRFGELILLKPVMSVLGLRYLHRM